MCRSQEVGDVGHRLGTDNAQCLRLHFEEFDTISFEGADMIACKLLINSLFIRGKIEQFLIMIGRLSREQRSSRSPRSTNDVPHYGNCFEECCIPLNHVVVYWVYISDSKILSEQRTEKRCPAGIRYTNIMWDRNWNGVGFLGVELLMSVLINSDKIGTKSLSPKASKNATGWSIQEPHNSSVSVSPLLTLSKWIVKNTIKRRKIGLVEWLKEGWNIFNGTPVDIEETTFFSKGCLVEVNYLRNYRESNFPLSVTR